MSNTETQTDAQVSALRAKLAACQEQERGKVIEFPKPKRDRLEIVEEGE